ncbi:MAG: septum formation protein Maf [Clostridia bacterium]|nr:septum formation protein Maf [Clostridia bacterium]
MEWILASASPRRRQLLKEIVPTFTVLPAKGDERVEDVPPHELVQSLAVQKAEEVATLPQANGKIVLGADTIVVLDGEVLGKPKDEQDAVRMLTALSGRKHQVYTGVCILYPENGENKKTVGFAKTDVYFNTLTKEQIIRYVQTGSPMDKAGAYGIQDGDLVERIDGSFSNVVGLPVELCRKMAERLPK